jgi:hypothetical protein
MCRKCAEFCPVTDCCWQPDRRLLCDDWYMHSIQHTAALLQGDWLLQSAASSTLGRQVLTPLCRPLLTQVVYQFMPCFDQWLQVVCRQQTLFASCIHVQMQHPTHTSLEGAKGKHICLVSLQIIVLAKEMGIKTINQVHRDTYVQELKDLGCAAA